MTLSDDKVIDQLNHTFVSGWTNIKGQTRYAGNSNTHMPTYAAKHVNACSGHHNVQMFFMTPDGRVLNVLPGFWNAPHFLKEAELAVKLGQVYYARNLSVAARNEKYLDMHLVQAYANTKSMHKVSKLQGFDYSNIAKREKSDFKRDKGFITGVLKTADQVIHERLAQQPFTPFESFDVAKFIDMGIKRYKYDYGVPESERGNKKKRKT